MKETRKNIFSKNAVDIFIVNVVARFIGRF